MQFHTGCRSDGGGRRIDQNISLAMFVCSSDLSCKFQLLKFHNFVKGCLIFQRKFLKRIVKNFRKFMKLSKLKFISVQAFHVDCSYKPTSVHAVKCRSHYARIRACSLQWNLLKQ